MTSNHKNGVTNVFYIALKTILKLLIPIHKKAMKSFKPDIVNETNFLITHIQDYIEKHESWLRG